ncbi:hypothetical protein [Bartonella sp. B1098]|uniref:hypothetical protein n=1 Tax=Bartonella sp. B1098 TaxID=2911421 RepID=UPI0020C1DC74|nr:hypothetical protein [Bartonella sp. B1098]
MVFREGEMSSEQIKKEIVKVSLQTPTLELETPHWNELPEIFRQFVAHLLSFERLAKIYARGVGSGGF